PAGVDVRLRRELAHHLALRRLDAAHDLRGPDRAAVHDGGVRHRLLQRRDVDLALPDRGIDGVRANRTGRRADALGVRDDAGNLAAQVQPRRLAVAEAVRHAADRVEPDAVAERIIEGVARDLQR